MLSDFNRSTRLVSRFNFCGEYFLRMNILSYSPLEVLLDAFLLALLLLGVLLTLGVEGVLLVSLLGFEVLLPLVPALPLLFVPTIPTTVFIRALIALVVPAVLALMPLNSLVNGLSASKIEVIVSLINVPFSFASVCNVSLILSPLSEIPLTISLSNASSSSRRSFRNSS